MVLLRALSRARHLHEAVPGAALTWPGTEVLPVFRALPDPAGQLSAHAVASGYLAELDGHLTDAAEARLLTA